MYEGKLIAASMIFRHFPLREAMAEVKKSGMDEMEVTIAGIFSPHFMHLHDINEREMREKAEEAAEIGVHVHALNVGWGYCPEQKEFFRQVHLNSFRLARCYGAEVVTFGCGGIEPGKDTVEGLKEIAEYLNVMSLIAWNEYGVKLSVEAPHRCTVSEKYDQILTYWANMPDRLLCTMDVAHLTYAGVPVEKAMRVLGDRLAHVHLRDAAPGNSMIPYGEGKVDFAGVFRLLDRYGYKGKCSLEFPAGETMEDACGALQKGMELLSRKREEASR